MSDEGPSPPGHAGPGQGPGALPVGRLQRFAVSSRGQKNGRSPQPNHGAPFGPDVPGTRTGGINEAIQRAAVFGGGLVELDPGAVFLIEEPIVLRSHVRLEASGAVVRLQAPSGPLLRTPEHTVVRGVGVHRLVLDATGLTEGWCADLPALQRCDLDLTMVNAPNGLRLQAPAQAEGADPLLHANVCLNRIRLVGDRLAGTGLLMQGESPTSVVTDNTFPEIYFTRVGGVGIDFAEWADSNLFGHAFVSLARPQGVGVLLNSVGQAQNHGVYNNLFAKLSVDAFGVEAVSAVRLFQSKMNVFSQLYTSPEGTSFPGRIVDDRGSESAVIYSAGENRTRAWGVDGPTPVRRAAAVSRATSPTTLISYPVERESVFELTLTFSLEALRSGSPRLAAYWVEESGAPQTLQLPLNAPGRLGQTWIFRAKPGTLISIATQGPFEATYGAAASLKEIG